MKTWKDRGEFKHRVKFYAEKIGVEARSISVRPMSNKWASCSTSGNLNFNAELLEMEKKLGDYVIVHELLHFQVPNHGKLWKNLMRAYLGNYYERIESRLQKSLVNKPDDVRRPQLRVAARRSRLWIAS